AHSYTFSYNAQSHRVETITAPPVNGKVRAVQLAPQDTTRAVRTITEQLGDSTYSVSFESQPGQALTYLARIDRRLTRTSFGNEPSSPTIAYFKTGLSTLATDTVRHG